MIYRPMKVEVGFTDGLHRGVGRIFSVGEGVVLKYFFCLKVVFALISSLTLYIGNI